MVRKYFFEEAEDMVDEIKNVLENPQHEENYQTSSIENWRFKCHHCEKDYKRVSSLKEHESGVSLGKPKKKKEPSSDELQDHVFNAFQTQYALKKYMTNILIALNSISFSRNHLLKLTYGIYRYMY